MNLTNSIGKRLYLRLLAITVIAYLAACQDTGLTSNTFMADKIFIGDHIITIDPDQPTAEAVAIQGDRILFVGDERGAQPFVNDRTEIVMLGDKALLPGFIDADDHLTMQARLLDEVNVSSPPVGKVKSITDLVTLLKKTIEEQNLPAGQWVTGFGYDDPYSQKKDTQLERTST